jgi:hypothetical protein
MGCTIGCQKDFEKSLVLVKTLEAIEKSDLNTLNKIFSFKEHQLEIDSKIIRVNKIDFNCLGYALWYNNLKSFNYLYKVQKASIKQMENLFNASDTSSLSIICEKNYLNMLKYYLPLYLDTIVEYPVIQEIDTKSSIKFQEKDCSRKYLPIHIACIKENISLMSYIHEYFKDKSYIPRYLDMEYKEESTGENCVLIACRLGSYKMITFLHKTCKLSFRVKNNLGHNPINVLLDGARQSISKSCFNCLRYLVEIVGVDVECMYKYSLDMANSSDIIRYLEDRLRDIGINVKKNELDRLRMTSYQGKIVYEDADETIRAVDTYNLSESKFRRSFSIDD